MMSTAFHRADAYRGYRFPGAVIAHAVWLYLRFPLSFRNVEEMLAERGIEVTPETIRCWVTKFGPQFASQLRKREARPGRVWHMDEMAVRIGGKQHWLWRAVGEHGATLDVLLQEQRDTDAAERFFQMLLGRAGAAPERINTDKLGSYAAALRRLPALDGVDHQRVRSAQRFLVAFTRTWNLFRPRRRSFTAPEYRAAPQERFAAWQIAADLRP